MKSYLLLIVPALFITLVSCTKDASESSSISDASLSSLSNSSDLIFARATHSEEGDWIIKMNQVAAQALADGIKNFPPNAMIVKEKYDASGKVLRRSVMYNAPSDHNASNNWLWSEFDANGEVIYSSYERGTTCQSCHAGATTSRGNF